MMACLKTASHYDQNLVIGLAGAGVVVHEVIHSARSAEVPLVAVDLHANGYATESILNHFKTSRLKLFDCYWSATLKT